MKDLDLIVPPPIPFADESIGELEEASKIMGVPTKQLVDDVLEGANVERVNPANAYERFFVPTGKIIVRFNKLDEAAYTAAVSDTVTKLMKALDDLEQAVMTEDYKNITKSGRPGGTAYLAAIKKFRTWLKDPIANKPPYQIFMKGNKKLPFWAFSTLPGVTCPGAGDCLVDPQDKSKRGWCYSFSAWRNITPYFRQLQNTLLIRLKDKSWIEAEAKKKFKNGQVVRLYVDGDFDSKETLTYWMHFCERFPQNEFYGYSKSWGFFTEWHKDNNGNWPSNYIMNLSSGTRLERVLTKERFQEKVREMLSLRNPKTGLRVARGTFRALKVESKFPKKAMSEAGMIQRTPQGTAREWAAHRQEVIDAAKAAGIRGDFSAKGVFVCPGYCGECLPGGKHACGDRRLEDMAIVIGIH
jgi:hypothetical protein